MIKHYSLANKLILMGVVIGTLVPTLGAFSVYKTTQMTALGNQISDVKLLKTRMLGELAVKFRDIRIQIRSVPIRGISALRIDEYLEHTKKSISIFSEAKKEYEAKIESEKERALFNAISVASEDFFVFGGNLISLASTHGSVQLDELARQVLEICPVKAVKVETAIAALIEEQTNETKGIISSLHAANEQINWVIVIGSIIGFFISVSLGTLVARSISRDLKKIADKLAQSFSEVTTAVAQVSANGRTLATGSEQQASALQETVSAIEEISSMIGKNSENARRSKESAVLSLDTANQGKLLVEELVNEVQAIQQSTVNLMMTVETGNTEISKIVAMINEIESKTKVINDIVFQTKLLSFNASVEAARAGEAGKGFAVVAEEVGNLAAMSGKSAKEISDLLSNSVQIVQTIVGSTRSRVEKQAQESKARVDRGIEIGRRCGESLAKILDGAKNVEGMVSEIALASQEQSTGVNEVTKAMHQMDQLTHENADISSSTANASEELTAQAQEMKNLVEDLYLTINGSASSRPAGSLDRSDYPEAIQKPARSLKTAA